MEEIIASISVQKTRESTHVGIEGTPADLGIMLARTAREISEKSGMPLPVFMSYIEFAAKKLESKDEPGEEEKDCENCPDRVRCQEVTELVKKLRGETVDE